jgi:hypothetical protein
VSIYVAVLAPGVIFELAPQGVADDEIGIFMRVVPGRGADDSEFVRCRMRSPAYQLSPGVSRFGNYPVRARAQVTPGG